MDSLSLIEETLSPLAGKTVLDVGCGGGFLAKALAARGADMVGIDPSADEVARARALVPAARFEVARGEAIPFGTGAFEGVVFLNSLHHVPQDAMVPALMEAGRVTRETGLVVVIEPLASGSFFAAFQEIEDETQVRSEAQEAIRQAMGGGDLVLVRDVEFVRRERFADLDQFLARATAADPARRGTVARNREAIARAFTAHSALDDTGGHVLDQPLRAHVLRRGGTI